MESAHDGRVDDIRLTISIRVVKDLEERLQFLLTNSWALRPFRVAAGAVVECAIPYKITG